MYDIACTLVLHLKVYKTSAMSDIFYLSIMQKNDPESKLLLAKFAIPAFHAFAHNPSCQVCRCFMKQYELNSVLGTVQSPTL